MKDEAEVITVTVLGIAFLTPLLLNSTATFIVYVISLLTLMLFTAFKLCNIGINLAGYMWTSSIRYSKGIQS